MAKNDSIEQTEKEAIELIGKAFEPIAKALSRKIQVMVYHCPFCKAENWFEKRQDLERHLYDQHIRESIHRVSELCLVQVYQKHLRWCVDE